MYEYSLQQCAINFIRTEKHYYMIPKTIHYCWFSGDKKNRFIRRCIKSWNKTMPDYKLRLWDSNSFNFNSLPYVNGAFRSQKWAFVADYIRLYALYTEGGIYLDTDVKTYRSFDDLLGCRFFIGTEPLANNEVEMEAAIMGAEPGHPFVKKCLEWYESQQWHDDKDWYGYWTVPRVMSKIAKEMYGYDYTNRTMKLADGIVVYDRSYFGHCFGTMRGKYYAIHYFNASWLENRHGKFYSFCKRNDFMNIYLFLEKIIKKFRKK